MLHRFLFLFVSLLVLPFASVHAQDLYRFYSIDFQGHFYTASVEERDLVLRDDAWLYEGVSYGVSNPSDAVPVYRFWSENYKHHFFTSSSAERDAIITSDPNWAYEGEVFRVAANGVGSPIYRFYSEAFRGHFYTASLAEKDHLEQNDDNWAYEGIAWYVSELAPSVPSLADVRSGIDRRASAFSGVEISGYPATAGSYIIDVEDGVLSGDASDLDRQVWAVVKDLAPSEEILHQITEFAPYYNPNPNQFSAFVSSLGGVLTQWQFAMDYRLVEHFDFLPRTVVHEYGHILTPQSDQAITVIDDFDIDDTCTTYSEVGICYNADSYLQTFYDFWAEDGDLTDDFRGSSEQEAYYAEHQDAFVSSYATSAIEEDFSETLEYSMFGDVDELGARARQKVQRIQAFPALSLYRSDVRNTVSGW